MTDRICLLLEALSVVVCLHHLYGEKFRLDIKTVGFLAVDMVIMEFINHYSLPKSYTLVIYPVVVMYCGLRFGFKIRELIVNNVLYMVIVTGIQLLIITMNYQLFDIREYADINLLLTSVLSFLIMVVILSKCKLDKVAHYLQNKERMLIAGLFICVTIVLYFLIEYKGSEGLRLHESILLFVSMAFIVILVVKFEKAKIEAKEIETELKMYELHSDSYKTLIENIRMRQHEFDNHISTIYSQHLLCDTYEGLVEVQKEYCKELEKENRYNKLLKYDNPVIRGFLYVKFQEAEKLGIEISYEIVIDSLNIRMPIYKMVEVLGDLINNAVEALAESEDEKKLHVSIIEVENKVEIEVRNTSRYISNKERSKFFEKGYSGKGENRGLGLYNVKKICEEYEFRVICDNREIDDNNWLVFCVIR